MPSAETARLIASLELQDKFSGPLGKAERSMSGLESKATKASAGISRAFGGIGKSVGLVTASLGALGGVFAATSFLKGGIESFKELQQVQAQSAAVLKSTGATAGVTAQQIRSLAESLEDVTTVDDKTVQAGENLLLTFTNIRNAAGAGNDIFNQTTKAVVDMALALNQGSFEGLDLKSTALQLGKALNDPVKGITALRKAGISFTEEQQKQIKALVKTGDLLGAQKIVLAEVNKEVGGTGVKQAATYAGKMNQLADAIEGVEVAFVEGLIPALTDVSDSLSGALKDPATVQTIRDLGSAIGGLVKQGLAAVKAIAPFGRVIADAWNSIPPEVRNLIVGGLITNKVIKIAFGVDVIDFAKKLLINSVLGINAGVVNVNGGVVNGAGNLLPTAATGVATGVGVGVLGGSLVGAGLVAQQGILLQETLEDLTKKGITDPIGTAIAGWRKILFGEPIPENLRPVPDIPSVPGIPGSSRSPAVFSNAVKNGVKDGVKLAFGAGAAETIVPPLTAKLNQLHGDFVTQYALLKTSTKPSDIAAAAARIAADVVAGVGSTKTTKDIIANLKAQIAATKDPATRKALEAALSKVQKKLPGREWIDAQKKAARDIVSSNKSTGDKVKALEKIQKDLISHGDTAAASIVGALVNQVVPAIDRIKLVQGTFLPPTSPTHPRNPNAPPVVPRDTRTGIEGNRPVYVQAHVTASDVQHAGQRKTRSGPTIQR